MLFKGCCHLHYNLVRRKRETQENIGEKVDEKLVIGIRESGREKKKLGKKFG